MENTLKNVTSNDLRYKLIRLKKNYGLIYLKAGTEWENMDYREIKQLYNIAEGTLPMLVKIAGIEAKVDLRHLQSIGKIGILGPMIESEYALEKFVATVLNQYDSSNGNAPLLAVNLETYQAYQKIDALINSRFFDPINLVVIGRLDLSLSMGHSDVDHSEVTEITKEFVKKVKSKGKSVSIGGFVKPSSAQSIKEEFEPTYLNTIHTMFDANKSKDIFNAIWEAIDFEIYFYHYLKGIYPDRRSFYEDRIQVSREKLKITTEKVKASN